MNDTGIPTREPEYQTLDSNGLKGSRRSYVHCLRYLINPTLLSRCRVACLDLVIQCIVLVASCRLFNRCAELFSK